MLRLNIDGFHASLARLMAQRGDGLIQTPVLCALQGLIREGDVLARPDTDEFLLAPRVNDEHVTAVLAQRLQDAVHEPRLVQDQESPSVARSGRATPTAPRPSKDVPLQRRHADRPPGRGGVYRFERGMDRVGAAQVEMQRRDLRHAVACNELALHFQPKLRATTGEPAGVEALLRWHHQTGHGQPGQFIPGRRALRPHWRAGPVGHRRACRHLRVWARPGPDIPVAVNLSVHQHRQPTSSRRVREAPSRARPHADHGNHFRVGGHGRHRGLAARLDMLDQIGVRLSIDDFGTRPLSLSYLPPLAGAPAQDRPAASCADLDSSLDAQAIVEAVVPSGACAGLKWWEGVETQDQADILAQLHCDELQGFRFADRCPSPR